MEDNFKDQFSSVCNELLQIIASYDEDEINLTTSPDTWSAGQIGEHLYKSYAVIDTLNGATKPANRLPDEKVNEVRELFLNFSIKMKSPEAILPSWEHIDKNSLLEALKVRIEEMKEVISKKDLTQICLEFAIPEYGAFTRYEWLYFNMVHTQRHIHQLKSLREKLSYQNH